MQPIPEARFLLDVYFKKPILLRAGSGMYLEDIHGNRYLDLIAGIAVSVLGHCHPKLVKTIQQQASKLIHATNLYYNENQLKLGEQLCQLSGLDLAFFCNSGAEAIEACLKFAIRATRKHRFISMVGGFHGRTLGALSVSYEPKFREPFKELLFQVDFVEYGNPEALENAITQNTAGVILEPIQGEGGVRIPPAGFLEQVRSICDRHGILLILDEIQTGMGRTGKWFCYQHEDLIPDLMALAKGLGGGMPIGAALLTHELGTKIQRGDHGSTFGGNPLSCAAALTTLQIIQQEGLLQNAASMGNYFLKKLRDLDLRYAIQVRGKGLMLGVEVRDGGDRYVDEFLQRRILINCTAGNVLRLVPPLIIQRSHVDQALDVFQELSDPFTAQH